MKKCKCGTISQTCNFSVRSMRALAPCVATLLVATAASADDYTLASGDSATFFMVIVR